MMFSTFSTGFSTIKRNQPYTHRNSGSRFLESFEQKCRHSAFYKKESRRIFFAFYKPFLSGDLFFSNLEWNGPKFSTPGRCRFSVWKRWGKLQFSTLFFPAEPSQSPAATAPPRGELFAVTETYRMNAKSFRQCYKLPLRGSWHRAAMTERVRPIKMPGSPQTVRHCSIIYIIL